MAIEAAGSKGVTLFLAGTKHLCVAAVCLRTLRRHWHGPVTIFAGDELARRRACTFAAAMCGDVDVAGVDLHDGKRNKCYATKPSLPRLSPYDLTVQLDVDTMVLGPIDDLFPDHTDQGAVTEFAGWVSTGRHIAKRIGGWADVAEHEVKTQLEFPFPAINTGVVAFGRGCTMMTERWAEMTARKPNVFISDEIAMQLLLLEFGEWERTEAIQWRLTSDTMAVRSRRWNWSPIYPGGTQLDAVRIVHFHGKKHTRMQARPIWMPEFYAAMRENWAGIAKWAPAGDKRLGEYLKDVEECTRK